MTWFWAPLLWSWYKASYLGLGKDSTIFTLVSSYKEETSIYLENINNAYLLVISLSGCSFFLLFNKIIYIFCNKNILFFKIKKEKQNQSYRDRNTTQRNLQEGENVSVFQQGSSLVELLEPRE